MNLKKKAFENIVGKGENAKEKFLSRFILSSANNFNLDQSKNLLFGKELT